MGARVLSGEVVEVFPARAGDLRVGDVVAFVGDDGRVVAHRLIRVEPGLRFITRRDAPGAPDPMWGPNALVGVVSRDGRIGRWIAHWPRLAIPLGAALRVKRVWDLPSAVLAAATALTIQIVRWRRRRGY